MDRDSKAPREQRSRLLSLYRRGHISEAELLEQLDEAVGEARSGDNGADGVGGRGVSELLDSYRAAEASGARTISQWADMTADESLAGALRTVAEREASHARLLERRLSELGASPEARVPEWIEDFNASILDPGASDLDRLAAIMGQFPDVDAALAPLLEAAGSIKGDRLTRELLLTIAEDEAVTLKWVQSTYTSMRG